MRYKIATNSDIPDIRALAEKIWPVTYGHILSPEQLTYMLDLMYSDAALEKQISSGDYQFLVFEYDEKAAGFAAYSTTTEEGVYKLHKLYLDTDLQGKSLGKLMLETVKTLAKKNRGRILELDVNRENKALHFYEKQGFTIYKTKDTDIGHG